MFIGPQAVFDFPTPILRRQNIELLTELKLFLLSSAP